MSFVSAVNQPERVFLNSNDDTTPPTEGIESMVLNGNTYLFPGNGFSRFTCRLPTPILKPKRTQLLRCAIPNAQVNIPDYDLMFWYARYDVTVSPPVRQLKCIRFLPTFMAGIPLAGGSTVPVNRQIASYTDLVSMLNASASSPADGGNPYFTSNDIVFSYDTNSKKISWAGNTVGYIYAQVGYNDVEVNQGVSGNPPAMTQLKVYTSSASKQQPYLIYTNLNLRCGFTFYELNNSAVPASGLLVNEPVIAPSWANLVYSQCVYIFCNIVAGSGMGSGGQHNLLSVVPMNAPSLGVSLYQAPMVNWLTRVPDEIYEITISMLDDNYQPFIVPNNGIVNVEMGFNFTSI